LIANSVCSTYYSVMSGGGLEPFKIFWLIHFVLLLQGTVA
jgi:hypothetical protein